MVIDAAAAVLLFACAATLTLRAPFVPAVAGAVYEIGSPLGQPLTVVEVTAGTAG
jgi:hypothetical protein